MRGRVLPSPACDLNYNAQFDCLTQLHTSTLISNEKYLSLEAVESK